jgi:hypothetical protein
VFIQQPVRIQAQPRIAQEVPVLLDSAIRSYYSARAQEYSNDVVQILKIDVIDPVLLGASTQVYVVISVEAETITFFNQFIASFFRREETDAFVITSVN